MEGKARDVRGGRELLRPMDHWNLRGETPRKLAHGFRVGNLVFVGGQVALDRHGQIIGKGDIAEQTRAVYQSLERVLHEAGASLSDVVMIHSYLVTEPEGEAHDEFWRSMAATRKEFFPDDSPPGTGVIVQGLIYPGLLIEVDCIAMLTD